MDDIKTIVLRSPITYGVGDKAKTYSELVLREPLSGEYEKAEALSADVDFFVALIALVAGVPGDVVDQCGVSVAAEGQRYFELFTDAAGDPPTSDEDWEFQLPEPLELKTPTGEVEFSASVLKLTEPTNKQRRKSMQSGGPWASAVQLLSLVSGVRRPQIRKMQASQFLKAIKYLNGFQDGRQSTAPD